MKIGEALTRRARLAQRLNDLQGRIKGAAMVQEGDVPTEDCKKLLVEYETVSQDHAKLVRRIQLSNATTEVEPGVTLLDMLQQREVKVRQRNITRIAANAGTVTNDRYRYMRSELKMVPQVDVAALHADAEEIDEEIRVIDSKIQSTNWQTELLGDE